MTHIRLWDGPAPGSEDWDQEEVDTSDAGWLRNVVVPTLIPYVPDGGADRAVVVAPGGAFHFLSMQHEGHLVAERIVERGVAAFVLKYRVIPTPLDEEGFGLALMEAFNAGLEDLGREILPLATADAGRAMAIVRGQGYDHVTFIGFSAGGRIAAELALRSPAPARPDATAAIYLPTVADAVAPDDAGPLFVLAAADDPLGIDGSLDLHRAWRDAGAPVELHLYEQGGHGFSGQQLGLPCDHWLDLFLAWHASLPD